MPTENAASAPSGTGRVTFHITWPTAAPSRLIPEASESIEIRVLDGAKVVKTVIVRRGQTKVTIEELPAKKLLNVLRAFPNADATGVVQAEGSVDVEIEPDETTAVSLSLESTVDKLLLTPPDGADIDESGTLTLGVSPRNAAGEVVLTQPNGFRFVSLSPDIATVDASGVVTGVTSGTAIIGSEVTEVESGKKSTFTTAVSPVGRVAFSEIAANITGAGHTPTSFNVYASEYFEASGAPIPNITYGQASAPELGTADQSFYRSLFVTLPPNLAVGQNQDVTLSYSNPYSVTFVETHTQKNSSGNEQKHHATL